MNQETKESEYREHDTETIDVSNLSPFSRDITLARELAEKHRRRGVDVLFVDGAIPVTSRYCEKHGITVYEISNETNLSGINSGSKVVYAVQGQEDREKSRRLKQNLSRRL